MIDLWLDDVRDPAALGFVGWTWVTSLDDAKALLVTGRVNRCSLDHDLGMCEPCRRAIGGKQTGLRVITACAHIGTGYDLVCWMEETGHWPKERPTVHSLNPLGAKRMQRVIGAKWTAEAAIDEQSIAERTRAVLRATVRGYAAGENATSKHWRLRAEAAEASHLEAHELDDLIDLLERMIDGEPNNPDVTSWQPVLDKLRAQRLAR